MAVDCSECGTNLDASWNIGADGEVEVEVEPCSSCSSQSFDSGYDDGYHKGVSDREEEIYDEIEEIVRDRVGEALANGVSKA